MAAPPLSEVNSLQTPNLTASFCYTPFALQTFLRQSRALLDDPISQQLSAFSQPEDKQLRSYNSSQRTRTASSSRVSGSVCDDFVSRMLLPAWKERSKVLQFCGNIANQEDSSDPDRLLREGDIRRKQEMIVNERLDPYSARFEVRESRQEALRRAVRSEWEVEEIVRRRSWGLLQTRCQILAGDWTDLAPLPNSTDTTSSQQ